MFPLAKLQQILLLIFTRSWKTTVAGFVYALYEGCPQIQALLNGQPIDKHALVRALCGAAIGYFAKDFNVSTEMQAGIPGAAMPIGTVNYQPPEEIKP